MTIDDPSYASALDLAAAIRDKKVSSRELLESFLARRERLDGPLNIVVTIDAERARAEADEADRRLASGDEVGPLRFPPRRSDLFDLRVDLRCCDRGEVVLRCS